MAKKSWVITGVGIVGVIGALTSYKVMEISSAIAMAEAFPEHSETVEKTVLQASEHTPHIQVLAQVQAPKQVILQNELAGKVSVVNHLSGAQVQKGEIIIQLDVRQERAQLAAAKAAAKVAATELERNQTLGKSQAVSQSILDQARANVLSAEASIAQLENVIRQKTIRAPFTGQLGLHDVREGQFLPMNSQVTSLVAKQQQQWLDFNVPSTYPALNQGQKLTVSWQGKEFNAQVLAQHSVVSNNHSLAYRASLPQTEQLLPNSRVQVQIPVAPSQTVFALPDTSVLRDGYGQHVYQLIAQDEPGAYGPAYRAQRLDVTVLDKRDGFTYVSHGLQSGQEIASQGAFKLFPNVLVYVKAPVADANAETAQSQWGE